MRVIRVISVVVILAVAVTGAAFDAGAQQRGGDPKLAALKNPVPPTPASVKAGQQAYAKNCRHCHGLRGRGDGPMAPKNPAPADLTDATWDFGGRDGEIYAVIMNGIPGAKSEMKGMKGTLSDRDVWNIVNYLRSIGPKAATR